MQSLSSAENSTTMTRGHRFVVTLHAKKNEAAELRSCEVMGSLHRNRFTFPAAILIKDVFVDEVAQGVKQCLASLSNRTEVVSLPTMTIEIPGLSLARAHLMTTLADDGSLNIILRFKVMLGAVTRAFRPELGIEDSVADHSADMSALVLTDIVMPLLDICTAAEEAELSSSQGFHKFIDTLIDRSRDVRFQAELIKRYVAIAPSTERRLPGAQDRQTKPDLLNID